MSHSLAEQLALLSEEEREKVLEDVDFEKLKWDASFWLRPEQMPPMTEELWNIWLILAGRGFGKSRAGAEWVRDKARYTNQGKLRFGLVARTAADVRDTIIEGESGILNVHPPSERPEYFPSKRQVVWPNGNIALLFTADEPDQLRGPNFHYAWGDEFAAWKNIPDASGLTAFDNMRIATRLGENPQICLTTTPKRVDSVRKLLKEAESGSVVITRGKTADNAGNLAKNYIDLMYGTYEGTRLAMQELMGEMLDDVEDALWMQDTIDDFRATAIPIGTPLRVVGVDPTVAERPGDECGIVVCSAGSERDLFKRQAYVLEDATVWGSPDVWAKRVVETARKWGAPVVAEKNQGGVLIRNAIHQIDPEIPVFEVWSKQGKALRAEPVSLCYEQGRVHHLGFFAELESQMTQWVPGESKSPDRIDALVLALTALLITPPKGFGGGHLSARSVASRKLPPVRPTGTTGRRGAVFGAGLKRR
jgi:phage terminase large subunit-like protein